jgi:hypothetical protein
MVSLVATSPPARVRASIAQPRRRTRHCIRFPQRAVLPPKLSPEPHKVKKLTRSGLVGTRPFAVPSCAQAQFDDGGSQSCAFAQQLASFVEGGRSIAGLRSKKPLGISLNPVLTHGWTGKSSVRTV